MMKFKVSKDIIENLIKFGALICLVLVMVQFHSVRTKSFRYHYVEGHPWTYEGLQAPFDFPIYKSNAAIEAERAEMLRNYMPCFRLEEVSIDTILDSLQKQYSLSIQERNKCGQVFLRIFSENILSGQDMQWLADSTYSNIKIIDDHNVAQSKTLLECFTPLTIYSKITAISDSVTLELIDRFSIYKYIVPNLTYDESMSEKLRNDILSKVAISEGTIQYGEMIIDRGEIVTKEKYQILQSLERQYQEIYSSKQSWLSLLGDVMLELFFVLLLILYLVRFRPGYYKGMKNVMFFFILVGIMVSLSAGAIKLGEMLNMPMCVYLVPLAWVPILIRVFFDARTSLYVHWITLVLVALMLDDPFTYVLIQVAVGMVVVTSLKDITVRSQLATTALYVFLTYSFIYTALTLSITGDITKLDWIVYVLFAINCVLLLLAYGLIFLCEKSFKMLSSMTLVELSNVNSELLMKLAQEAPGTFQHSLQVANLASEAAKKIGADSLLVRTGAMYHDIGKMVNPQNFTENQQGGVNPLSSMPIMEAVAIILAHVTDGESIAKKNHLPQKLIDFIVTHHGTSKARYFYNTYVNTHPNEKVDESLFMYKGLKPFTREQGILMMADAVEARSRSLNEYSEKSIDEMVEQMVNAQINDGQLNQTPLTFKDIEDIKAVLKEKLRNIYHHRITYPELNFQEKEK